MNSNLTDSLNQYCRHSKQNGVGICPHGELSPAKTRQALVDVITDQSSDGKDGSPEGTEGTHVGEVLG